MGGSKKKGDKKFKLDEFLPIFSDSKKDKDMGTYEDFMECMKLYDKAENGIMKDCGCEENEDGEILYSPFLKKLMAGHYPK